MFLRKCLLGILGMVLAVSMVAFAQQPQGQTTQTPDGTFRRDRTERRERHRERMGRHKGWGRHGGAHFQRELNLTEEQRQQSRAIMQRRMEATKSQREELFQLREKRIAGSFTAEDEARAKALRQEIRSSMEGVRAEMEGILTAEQKDRLEELKAERKAKHELRMKEREEFFKNKQQ